ncbi:KxYKxGKxW signal peptide domain-containing protein, partial [Listeria innocua]|uniref:leucine-rich repeat domain-containing protein n=1 Tax=Listeria innocua TaxID=1642 RepID=UPI001628026F
MRFSRKERERAQKNWRMWKKGKQWICGAALFFMVVSSPGMLVLADEVNAGDATEVTAGEEAPPLPEESTENEMEGAAEEGGMPSSEVAVPEQREENTTKNNETKAVEGKKERPKQGRLITSPTAINVVFPDAKLAEVIRVKLGKASVSNTVTQSDLDSISTLSANNKRIANISGMEHLINLTDLRLDYNQLSDISVLSGLTNLTSLNLRDNQLSDISVLSGLTNLTSLDLNNTQLSDISVLSGLTNLTSLNLNNNQLSDISVLSSLTNLTNLNLDNTQLSDISVLSGLTNLTNLNLRDNQLSDISVLSGLTNLTSLDLNNTQLSDISVLSGLTNLINLNLSNNQLSDISALSSLINLRILYMENNQISDISSLNESQFELLYVADQQITLSGITWSNPLEVPFIVKDTEDHDEITPSSISNNGQFADGIITWNGLSNSDQRLSYSWSRGGPTFVEDILYEDHCFSGRVTIQMDPASVTAVKILVDSDGNSQTTEDQTLFAEDEDEDWDSAEDVYNYAKEQLNGTDYGLISIEMNSNGDYVILVSKVGALKKEDSNGIAIGTDVFYTPTYTVTGTGDDAELVVSYAVSMDAPPTGYVYIYGKGTTQEARYIANTPITIPLTDTNGNGVPQWKEDYTVAKYQRAGALKPTTPDGSQVPGGTISIPDDAIEGDIITVPDTITGSDGRDYGIDSSVDTDSTTPGVQVTLTEDEQDVPYFDILLSESISQSTSESVSQSTSESISQSTSESVSQSTSESISQSTSESVSQSTSESISQSMSESVSQSTSESISQ